MVWEEYGVREEKGVQYKFEGILIFKWLGGEKGVQL